MASLAKNGGTWATRRCHLDLLRGGFHGDASGANTAPFLAFRRQNLSQSASIRNRGGNAGVPSSSNDALSDRLRALMRSSAQPVAVITTVLGDNAARGFSEASNSDTKSSIHTSPHPVLIHGATLSSFVTLSLVPVPRVAFSLQLPSRMADSLLTAQEGSATAESPRAHFIVNILAASQAGIAESFAKPGLRPYEWTGKSDPTQLIESSQDSAGNESTLTNHDSESDLHPLASEQLKASSHAFGQDNAGQAVGVPMLTSSLGSLACSLEATVDLSNEGPLSTSPALRIHPGTTGSEDRSPALDSSPPKGSRLFIARVHHVELPASPQTPALTSEEEKSKTDGVPLIYWQQQFCTVGQR